MALSQRKSIYGVHSVCLYDPDTKLPIGDLMKVVGNLTINLSGELTALNGGSQPFPWTVEAGLISTEITLLLREYPNSIYQAFLGKAVTENAADAGGDVSTIANVKGTTVANGTTGIASVAVKSGSEEDVKTGIYVIKAASATTVDVYCLSDIDFNNGTDITFQDDTLKITASALTVPDSGSTVDVPSVGLQITGGSGTVAFTTGDTAVIEVRAINEGSQEVVIGDAALQFNDVGIVAYAQKAGSKAIYEIDLFRCKGAGAPINFAEKAFSEAEIPVQAFYDSTNNGVFKMRRVENAA